MGYSRRAGGFGAASRPGQLHFPQRCSACERAIAPSECGVSLTCLAHQGELIYCVYCFAFILGAVLSAGDDFGIAKQLAGRLD